MSSGLTGIDGYCNCHHDLYTCNIKSGNVFGYPKYDIRNIDLWSPKHFVILTYKHIARQALTSERGHSENNFRICLSDIGKTFRLSYDTSPYRKCIAVINICSNKWWVKIVMTGLHVERETLHNMMAILNWILLLQRIIPSFKLTANSLKLINNVKLCVITISYRTN